uniref:Uncharacterized protein n=1 Tax=Arundo donax TaxID=35708 RepID=A0A0A9CTN9_ARUDO
MLPTLKQRGLLSCAKKVCCLTYFPFPTFFLKIISLMVSIKGEKIDFVGPGKEKLEEIEAFL